ncbi:hypothetical protein EI546_05845 [Aequorivita sp. H23M31]|uniref:Uncharacterized protein n=1 Tax=Aequorivita ciconiae TaxID=2494375 RepID=A0A410G1X0_9FLAO|nr:hypothetical protein [Aequorivita sp. H23M31]QAA81277.1 hypothetical protein EI546_05845 [Aequorivita sp. H23M31]
MLRMPLSIYVFAILYLFQLNSLWGQVGINTEDPQTMLDINGNISLKAGFLTLVDGENNIVAADLSLYNISGPTTDFSINGIHPLTEVDGQIITLVNTTPHKMKIVHNSAGGPSGILCTSNGNLILKGIYNSVTLQYIKSIQRWITVASSDASFKNRIYSSIGNTDISNDSNNFIDMDEMVISLIPKKSRIYINVSIAGYMDPLTAANKASHGYADFQLVKTIGSVSTPITAFTSLASDVDYSSITQTAWNSRLVMFPVEVTPGEAISIQLQWRVGGQDFGSLYSNPSSSRNRCHRSITILD